MKTSIKNLLLLLLLLGFPAVVQAQFASSTNADGSSYYYTTNADGSANIEGYGWPPPPTSWLPFLTIPSNINGLTVSSIGAYSFDRAPIGSITIPDSVTSIGNFAFSVCSMSSVILPNSVTNIGGGAFQQCTSLTNITIPNSVTSVVALFAYCSSLESVTIPDSVTNVDDFYECSSLTTVTLPDSVTSIGPDAFDNCTSLTNVTTGNGVTSIGPNAFSECASLTNFTIPNGVTSIGNGAFGGCGLTSVTIPNSVTSIGEDAFEACFRLRSLTILNGVTNIGADAFEICSGLTSVTIPASVTSIGGGAFYGCPLTAITVDTNNATYSSLNGVLFDKSQSTLIECPYASASGSYTIPNSVTSIGPDAFEFCSGLTSVTMPASVTSIGDYAFDGCTRLTSVYFNGNAPSPANDSTVFSGDGYYPNPVTVYYLPGTTGWGPMFDGLPTAPWFLPNPVILNNSTGFGVQPGGFGFTISWATNASVVVEAATNLANPVWIPVSTNTLTGGTNYFSDPQWTNYPMRFYRVQLSQ